MGLGITISVDGNQEKDLEGASLVEIYESLGETTLFTITYAEDIADGDLNLLKDSRLDPGSKISIAVEVNDEMVCLVKGPVFSQRILLQHGGEGSSVQIKGGDTSIAMDNEFKSTIWSDVTDAEAVTNILGKYHLSPDVKSTDAKHLEKKHTLIQNESDLRFVKRLARRNGCYFWITCNLPGEKEDGHFQRPKLDASPAAELIINDQNSNIAALTIQFDTERPNSIIGKQIDLNTKEILNGDVSKTPQTILGSKSLQDISKDPHSLRIASPTDDAGDLKTRSEAALIESDWFVRATCSTSLHKLGKVVRANTIVNLVGAGSRHSGKYLVYSVRHIIDATVHVMEIELVRNGWNEASGGGGLLSKIF